MLLAVTVAAALGMLVLSAALITRPGQRILEAALRGGVKSEDLQGTRPPPPPVLATEFDAHAYLAGEDVVPGGGGGRRSWVRCVGSKYTESDWLTRSCHYRNLCHDGSTGRFVYFSGEGGDPGRVDVSLSPGSADERAGVRWAPDVRAGTVPAGTPVVRGAHVLYSDYNSMNVGHMVWDVLWPWWRLLGMFGLPAEDFRHLRWERRPLLWSMAWLQRQHRHEERRVAFARSKRNFVRFTPLLTRHMHVPLESYAHEGLRCFEDVVAGMGSLGCHCARDVSVHGRTPDPSNANCNAGLGPLWWQFRSRVLERARVPGGPPPCAAPRVLLATTLSPGKREGANWAELAAFLRHQLGATAVVDTPDLPALPVRDQLAVTASAAVFVSACGGGASTATFLPRGATVLLFCGGITKGSPWRRDDWPVFENLAYARVHYVDVHIDAESHTFTIDVPATAALVARSLDEWREYAGGGCGPE